MIHANVSHENRTDFWGNSQSISIVAGSDFIVVDVSDGYNSRLTLKKGFSGCNILPLIQIANPSSMSSDRQFDILGEHKNIQEKIP